MSLDDVSAGKPDPEPYREAARRFALPAGRDRRGRGQRRGRSFGAGGGALCGGLRARRRRLRRRRSVDREADGGRASSRSTFPGSIATAFSALKRSPASLAGIEEVQPLEVERDRGPAALAARGAPLCATIRIRVDTRGNA